MLIRVLSEVGEMLIHVIYLVKPSPEIAWKADCVSTGKASAEREVRNLKFNLLFVVIDCVWQYYKTNNTSGEKMGNFKHK